MGNKLHGKNKPNTKAECNRIVFLSEQASEYNKNSYKSIRSALNRHLQDLGRDIDIVCGREFRSNNSILDGKLKNG
jgi:hypothetical protein